uniref:RING-type E3 ubiquitin transferase n=1 Tax=Aureoumbra lagunensis TaxID=44058 RepID=A0A7S3NI99_9STRA|mmetsp:Transcript_1427/g.2070  ORF Transcript_1427/g.2070 Transcript_1427/m.2070 type:complete len:439 (+) Transcript_1427:31-1347(+)
MEYRVVELGNEQVLRDEFRCPITQQLLRVPVIAADGHSYELSSMERWLENHSISPKTGEFLEHKRLVPNHNLKRLIEDLVQEGGHGLYSKISARHLHTPRRTPPASRCADRLVSNPRSTLLKTEPLLLLQCLDPNESTWNGKCFEVSTKGVVGGRLKTLYRREIDDATTTAECIMPFSESTISRRHFEISFAQDSFWLMDLDSASGTFLRLRPGAKAPLLPGSMFMLGKHQLIVMKDSSFYIDDENDAQLLLECFAPDGSPLQNQVFVIGQDGATLGRRSSNTISFSHQLEDQESVGIDTAISSEHARIETEKFSDNLISFFLRDGATAHGRLSTNGTWIRLPPLSSFSNRNDDELLLFSKLSLLDRQPDIITNPPPPPHIRGAIALQTDDEFLVGTIRFHVAFTHSVIELDDDVSSQLQPIPFSLPPPPPEEKNNQC